VFYTEAADHYNCPVGSYTHGVTLPPERAQELQDVVGTMVGLQYIRMEEVGALPRRADPFRLAVYAPLAEAPAPPDVVLVRGRARQIMLVAEAARAAGIAGDAARIAERSGCRVVLEADEIPLAPRIEEVADLPFWTMGEDYELLAAVAAADADGLGLPVVGRCEEGSGVEVRLEGRPLDVSGWDALRDYEAAGESQGSSAPS
jgi:hypothetical protein